LDKKKDTCKIILSKEKEPANGYAHILWMCKILFQYV